MIYALCDIELLARHTITFEQYINICKSKDVAIIQYRDKISSIDTKRNNLLLLRSMWDETLIVNDDISLAQYCDGVHIGQDDLASIDIDPQKAISVIRNMIKDKIIGLSTHNKDEILIANTLDIDYIGLGAYKATNTKKDVQYILGDDISHLAKLSRHKVGAIGGVKLDDKIDNIDYYVIGSGLL